MKINRADKTLYVTDGQDRGPLTMARVKFHPSDTRVFAQCVDRRLAMWNSAAEPQKVDRKKEKYIVGELVCPHEIGWVRGFDIHPGGMQIVTGGSDRSLRLWDVEHDQISEKPAKIVSAAHDGWIEAVAYSPDASVLVTVGADHNVKVWNASDLKPIKTLTAHTAYCADVAFAPDGKEFATGGEDGLVIVWDAKTYKEVRRIDFGNANTQTGQNPKHSGVHRMAISHDGRWLGVAGGQSFSLFDFATGEIVATDRNNMDIAFHPAADVVAIGESELKAWEYDPAKLKPPAKDKNGKPQQPKGIEGKVITSIKRGEWSLGVQFSSNGKQLALGKSDGSVELYDVQ